MSTSSTSSADSPEQPAPGRTPPLDPAEAERALPPRQSPSSTAFATGMRTRSGRRLWRAAPDAERDFYQGLIQVAAGLLHLQRRNLRGARDEAARGARAPAAVSARPPGRLRQRAHRRGQPPARGSRGRRPAVPHSAGHPLHRRRRARLQPMTDDAETRVERDSMGEVRVPASAKWGAQTQRAVENFPISGRGLERAQIEALARIKAAVASVKRDRRHRSSRISPKRSSPPPTRSRAASTTTSSRSTSSRPARARAAT